MIKSTPLSLFALLSAFVLTAGAFSQSPEAEPASGRKIAQERCASCHAFEATAQLSPEDLIRAGGPPLFYAGNKFRQQWLEKWLVSPTRIRPAGYLPFRYVVNTPAGDRIDESALPDHLMLSAEEARQVAGYLVTLKKELNPYPTGNGESSIRAETHFEKILGCAACHQAHPNSGGLSGPELYTVSERLSREWVVAYLTDPFSWSVGPMPKVNMRGDQLLSIRDYIFQPGSTSSPPAANSAKTEPNGAKRDGRSFSTNRGEMLYQIYCSQCHGMQGNGKGINAPYMFVAPRNHTSFEEMSMLTDDRLFAVIKYGGSAVGKSTLMPSWSAVIKDSDINLLVQHLRTLSNTGGAN